MSAATVTPNASPSFLARIQDLILPIGMIASVLVIMVPIRSEWMDLLLSANITVAVIMLLTTLYVRTPLEFNIFPSLLLATTLFRLVLNVATTRLILTRVGSDGDLAAGEVVRTFGQFVTGGAVGAENIVVGLVIFAIIVLIQFVVITKGAGRISEVAARFTLDGMPGRQMAIDADLNADFFGAMDGASKFVRGDAIAGLVIILINIVGGLCIGVFGEHMSLSDAGRLYTTLTIGDGLVTQVPAFLISLAAGMLVTRSSQPSNLPQEFLRQLFSRPQALAVAGGFLAILVFTNLPRVPLLAIGAGCMGMAVVLSRRENKVKAVATAKERVEAAKSAQRVEDYLAIDPLELELGVGLIRLADRRRGGDLLDRIQRVRQNLAAEMGIILPKVRVRDNMRLEPSQFQIKIADMAVARGAIDGQVSDPGGMIAGRLSETVRQHADELLSRDAVKHLVEELKQASPAVVEELIPGVMKLGEVQQVLQLLLREGVSIRQLGPILEAIGDHATRTKDPALLNEYVRQRLARTFCTRYCDAEQRLHVVTLDPALEERIREAGSDGRLAPREIETICRAIEKKLGALTAAGYPPIVLVSPEIRATMKNMTLSHIPELVVLSYGEVTRDTRVESAAMVEAAVGGQRAVVGYQKSA
jgi:flagellar biosynthesis protein FlhA